MLQHLFSSLPMMVCAVLSVLIMLDVRNPRLRAMPVLLVYMLTATLLYLGHYVFFCGATPWLPVTDTLYAATNLSVYPLYLIYIIELTSHRRARHYLFLLPAVAGGIAVGTLYAAMDGETTARFIDSYLYGNQTAGLHGLAFAQACVHNGCKLLFALEVVVTVVAGSRLISHYDRRLDQFYADTDDKSLYRIRSILYLVLIVSCLSFAANAIGRPVFARSPWMLAVPSLLFSALLLCIGYIGLHQEFSAADMTEEKDVSHTPPSDIPSIQTELAQRITEAIDSEHLYLQPNLKLTDLATLMATNRTYVQQAISQELGVTFNELINSRRIAYAKKLKEKNPRISASELAQRAGFASLSAYYRNLKAYGNRSTDLASPMRPNAKPTDSF